MAQNWRAGEAWQPKTVEDHPDGFFPNEAYRYLQIHLPKQEDKAERRSWALKPAGDALMVQLPRWSNLRRKNENMGYLETAS